MWTVSYTHLDVYKRQALDNAGIPHIKLGIDQQMRDFGQAATAIQAFADVLEMNK